MACGNGYACAGTSSEPKSLRVAYVSGTTRTGNRAFVSRSDGDAATCRNTARACRIGFLQLRGSILIAVVASSDPVTRSETTRHVMSGDG